MKTRWKNAMTFSESKGQHPGLEQPSLSFQEYYQNPTESQKEGNARSQSQYSGGQKLMTTESITEEVKPKPKRQFEFVPKLRDKKVVIRLASGGQPVTGTLVAQSSYEILIKTTKGSILVFKHAIATIDEVDEPKGYKLDANY
jgi:sRNA-binding regulator protein Hfq